MKIARNTLTGLYFARADFTAPRSGATALPVREGLFVTLWPFPVQIEDTEAGKAASPPSPLSNPSEATKTPRNPVSVQGNGLLGADAEAGTVLVLTNPKTGEELRSPFGSDALALERLNALLPSLPANDRDFPQSIAGAAAKGRLSIAQRFWLHKLAINAPRERKAFSGHRSGNRWAARRR